MTSSATDVRSPAAPDIRRPSPTIVAGFRRILEEYSPSCLVADARQRRDVISGLMPVSRRDKIVGPVRTLQMTTDELADCPTVLLRASPGDIVLIACSGQTHTAMWGGLMSTLAQKVGIAGVIVDGAVRDVDEIRDLRFPVWHAGTVPRPSPTFVHGRTEPVHVDVPVVVRGLVINPGDLVVADENGIAVVPNAEAEQTLADTRALIDREAVIRRKIDTGMSVADLLAEIGHI